MATDTVVRPVVATQPAATENAGKTWVNNVPDSIPQLDEELAAGFALQTELANETDFRLSYLANAVIASNKSRARQNVAMYDRSIDQLAKLPIYKKTHTRDAVEQIFLATRDGKILAEIRKMSAEYLENHK